MDYRYKKYILSWKVGGVDGNRGIIFKGISGNIRRYLIEKYKNKCSKCGWNKKHPITGSVPLEIDHIDGNSSNNLETNLQLLCPNCHALTPYFRNLNKGRGRKWRKDK
jgi:Zn finger protein HypA/HybF involved in hydrogenase expression